MRRYQETFIEEDLKKKMVFISGPRQVGKTWISHSIAKNYNNPVYLNYDLKEDREIIEAKSWLPKTDLLVFDEIHKMPEWKNYLKGVYDTKPESLHILVTGSARLEVFRQSGDSLAGRFFRHRLLPFSLKEIDLIQEESDQERLIERSGFPEPFLLSDEIDAKRWRDQYIDGLIRTDILDFEKVHDFKSIQLVLKLLQKRVGSPISYTSIAEDVGISPNTVKKYIEIFESLYIIFRVTPFSKNIARSLLKEPKIYFFDTGLVDGDEGARFENFIAVSLFKHCLGLQDYQAKKMHLNYLRTKEKKEVDFCLVDDEAPVQMIEVKNSLTASSKQLFYFYQKYDIPGVMLFRHLRNEKIEKGIVFRKSEEFLKELFL